MDLYEWPIPNPAPKPTRHWGLDKIVRVRSYEFVRIGHLVKYVRIGHAYNNYATAKLAGNYRSTAHIVTVGQQKRFM